MTRELKLALIVGVTLVLGIAVLISDHLATKRRPKMDTEVAVQPAMAPPPAVLPKVALAPEAAPVSEPATEPVKSPVNEPARDAGVTELAIKTPGVSGKDADIGKATPADSADRGPGRVGPQPLLLTRQTSAYDDGYNDSLPKAPRTHVVAEGDSAYKIAKRYLGEGSRWKQIVDANAKTVGPEGQLKIGATLIIPESGANPVLPVREVPALAKVPPSTTKKTPPLATNTVKPAPAKETAKPNRNKQYTVRPGDTLSGIARRELGSPARAEEIAELNKSLIKDPDSLPLGAAIRLPAG